MSSEELCFVRESNKIEGILREPTDAECAEYLRFMALPGITVGEMEHFVSIYQPGAKLRDKAGMDVRVGNHIPKRGSPDIRMDLAVLLGGAVSGSRDEAVYRIHQWYETLHPFMDGNGRSGRMLWMWMMRRAPLGFLHHWYYQSLQYGGSR